jgi:EpsI family protein
MSVITPARLPWVAIAVFCSALALTHAGAILAKPTKFWADVAHGPAYSDTIPNQFGDWVYLPERQGRVVNPVQEEELMKLYSETVAKTFIHKPTGRAIMLSIAYGRNQSTDVQIHTPEQCYPSQGFKVENRADHDLATPYGNIKTVRLQTSMGAQRKEPLTFFLRVGDQIARGSKERNLARLSMAIHGYLIDGMLFRVSEISSDAPSSFKLQDQFIQDLLASVNEQDRARLIGSTRM